MKLLFDFSQMRIIQIVMFGCFLLGVYYFIFFDNGTSLKSSIKNIKNNITKVESQVQKTKLDLKNVKEFERETLNEKKVIDSFLEYIPESLTYTELSTFLIRSADRTGINIENKVDQSVEISKESEYQALKIELDIQGSFSRIMFFLSELTAQKRMFIVEKIDMRLDKTNRLIKAKLNITAYRYQKIEQKEKESEEV